jgi:phosphopantothenoylcysteine decarboxylase/phosphopantothenate--cysteine ligase
MNVNMYENLIYQRNENSLRQLGYHFIDPAYGALACGYSGQGKLPAPEAIFAAAQNVLSTQDLAGQSVLVTAGPTREELDPVRYISNYSSGKMGYAIARAAQQRGAKVVLVSGPTFLTPPEGVELVSVVSAAQMRAAVFQALEQATIVIKAAAVADYRPLSVSGQKLKKKDAEMFLSLEKNPDILAEIGANKQGRILVGFAAETQDLLQNATLKLRNKNLDLIVANDITQSGAGFDVDTNVVKLLHADGSIEELPQLSKVDVAHQLLDRVVQLVGAKG